MKTDDIQLKSLALLNLAGVSYSPTSNYILVGNTISGAKVYSSKNLATSDDLSSGAKLVHVLAAIVTPFNVLSKKEKDAIEHLAATSGNRKIVDSLDKDSLAKSGIAFSKNILSIVKSNTDHKAGTNSAGVLYDTWGVLSPAQKSLAIAALGIQTHQATSQGGPVCDLKIIDGKDQVFTVQDALDLLKAGKNPYGLVLNWEQIRKLHAVFGGKPTPEAMFDFADSHELLGKGTNDAAILGVSSQAIIQNGGKAAPQYGVGAIAIPSGKTPPQGYAKTAQLEGGDLISPQANIPSAAGALQNSLTGTKAGQHGVSSGAANIYSKWVSSDKKSSNKGVEGGSALIAGASKFKKTNPYLYGALVAFLSHYTKDSLSSNNPIEYIASLAGVALSRLVTGKKEAKAEMEGMLVAKRIGSQTPGEFAKVQINLRGLYASFGVSSKADAYQLSNQAYAEDRINELDLVAMQEIFNVVYDDNGLDAAQKLMNGKDRGLEIIRANIPVATNKMAEEQASIHKEVLTQMIKEEARQRNAVRYAKQQQKTEEEIQESSDNSQEEGVETPSNESEGSSFDNAQATAQSTTPQMGATP